ncbi:MAG: response regulator transcription factor [Planctomycetia bacterium]|nr:response regulator transcription factor [Planctomycetia bacterium]
MAAEKLLIVDDEKDIADVVTCLLNREGYHRINYAATGEDAIRIARSDTPDLIFLDLMLPGMSGLDVCRTLKNQPETAAIPIIMLTAKSDESDIVVGLELGADDYITKPFSSKLLLARMRAVLRRCNDMTHDYQDDTSQQRVVAGPLVMDLISRCVELDNATLNLTFGEFEMLKLLASHPNRVFTRNQLVCETRGDDYPVTDRAIDVQILGLRRKLKTHAGMIETIRGIGYRFTLD